MKICLGCEQEKPLDDFRVNSRAKDGRTSRCKDCLNADGRVYSKTEERLKSLRETKRRAILRNHEYVLQYLFGHPCVDCGNDNPVVLEFDHVRGEKENSVTLLILGACSIKRIAEEIEKCEVRCANCHRIATAERGKWFRATSGVRIP